MDYQASGIYFPIKFAVALSTDGKNYREVATHNEPCVVRGKLSLKDFALKFNSQEARYIKITLKNIKTPPS